MMLPHNHPATPPLPALVSMPPAVVAEQVADHGNEPSHADYNLHPIGVKSLDHYAEHDGDERFHVR